LWEEEERWSDADGGPLRAIVDTAESATTREGDTGDKKNRNLRRILNVVILSGTA